MTDDGFERLGDKIGHIRLTSVIGQGGMGTVYAGFDETLQRHVAVKAIHGDFRLNQEAKARFLREARILSQLNHPLTCTIHDYVEGDSNDFLIMELVKGRSLREALKEEVSRADKLAIAEQLLEVLVDVHGMGVIHRDLKPENIMIEPGGRIKVLDFGLSRSVSEPHSSFPTLGFEEARNRPAIDPVSIGESVYVKTKHGAILGTAAYMSPEQARGEAATAASDVYSVGLILQELFTGKRAFEEDLPPSELLQRATRAETQTALGLPKDLKNLIDRMKSAVPGARPSSADALGQLRFIIDKPRQRRRKVVFSALWVLIALFSAVATLQWMRAEREAERAETQALRAEEEAVRAQEEANNSRAVTDFMVDLFKLGNPDQRGSTATVKEVLAESVPKLELQLGDRPQIQMRLLETIGSVYENLGLFQESLSVYEKCIQIAKSHDGDEFDNALRVLLLKAGKSSERAWDLAMARRYYGESLEFTRRRWGPKSVFVLSALDSLGSLAAHEEKFDDAISFFEQALEIAEASEASNPRPIAVLSNSLGGLYFQKREMNEAKRYFLRALDLGKRYFGEYDQNVGKFAFDVGSVCKMLGDLGEAERWYREATEIFQSSLGFEHPSVATSLEALAQLCLDLGRVEEAGQYIERALRIREMTQGPAHPEFALSLINQGVYYLEFLGEPEEAFENFERADSIFRESVGEDNWYRAISLSFLARARVEQGDYRQGEELASRAIHFAQAPPDQNGKVFLADALHQRGRALTGLKRFREADQSYTDCLSVVEELGKPFDKEDFSEIKGDVLEILEDYISLLKEMGDVDKIRELEQRAGQIRGTGL